MRSLGTFFELLRVPMPWPRKLRLVLRNTSYKVVHRSACCGHPGEPGC